ncbi:hypothetical protein ACFV42_23855 [Streptomyces solisilvae]|uniref:hypothetical protein n=1 Tax=Streptomyces malaysiensis TaxID=92644 RepID=UPI00368F38EF
MRKKMESAQARAKKLGQAKVAVKRVKRPTQAQRRGQEKAAQQRKVLWGANGCGVTWGELVPLML